MHHEGLHLPDSVITPPPDHSSVSLAFYRDQYFSQAISGPPLHINVGDTVYVKAFIVPQDMDIKLLLHSCYMKPKADANEDQRYFIIKDG